MPILPRVGAIASSRQVSSFEIFAAQFANTSYYLYKSTQFTGAADSTKCVFSAWVNLNDNNDECTIFTAEDNADTNSAFWVGFINGDLRVIGENSSGTQVLLLDDSGTQLSTGTWYHILVSFDTATGVDDHKVYINDSQRTMTETTFTNDAQINFSVAQQPYIGARNAAGADSLEGCCSEVFYYPGEYLDLTVESNRRKFIDGSGNAVNLGADGSTPIGTQPLLYWKGKTDSQDNFRENLGSGGNFTNSNFRVACASTPPV